VLKSPIFAHVAISRNEMCPLKPQDQDPRSIFLPGNIFVILLNHLFFFICVFHRCRSSS
jgi:hypothetical protein